MFLPSVMYLIFRIASKFEKLYRNRTFFVQVLHSLNQQNVNVF
jgi:hypothetical protein